MALQSPLDALVRYARNYITLVDAKRENEMGVDSMSEATSQAIALSEVTGYVFFRLNICFSFSIFDNCVHRNQTIRYCLSDGHEWMFAVYTRDAEGNRVSYEGPLLEINDASRTFEKDVQRLVEVLYHWVCLCLVTGLVGSLLTHVARGRQRSQE